MQANVELVKMLTRAFHDQQIDTSLENCSNPISWNCVARSAWMPVVGAVSGKNAVQHFVENLACGFLN